MKFAAPQLLQLLWLVPAAAVLVLWSARRRRRLLDRFADSTLLAQLMPGFRPGRRVFRSLLLLGALACLSVAAARPQWGKIEEEVRQVGVDIVVIMDTSLSMLAQDVGPSRIERAKLELAEMVQRLQGNRLSLVVFSSSAHVLVPLTLDVSVIEMFLDVLDTEITSGRGTALAEALDVALTALPENEDGHQVIVLLSDGEDHVGGLEQAMNKARDQQVIIHAVGIGTEEGAPIPTRDPFVQGSRWKTEEGRIVTTRLEEENLRALADATGGTYLRLGRGTKGLDEIREAIESLEERTFEGRTAVRYRERYQWPLAAGLLLLLARSSLAEGRREGERFS